MHVVIVESPAKAKTINKYLGRGYQVLASFGHVRDLPAKDGSVRPEEGFAMSWEVDGRGEKRLREIAEAVRGADQLYLATDPDREGEAISWHIVEELLRRRALSGQPVKRVVFNEITHSAVVEAFKHPRELNRELIDAYLARRALDYLVGFTLSPVLWRKLPGSRSAGRVQSVALRLVCEREAEIEAFRRQEYWTVEGEFDGLQTPPFRARLVELDGRKLEKLELGHEGAAMAAVEKIRGAGSYRVLRVEKKQARRHPQPPFTTSTLQQEAARKLGFSATRTMRTAQRLYEGADLAGETVGLITYMRTDGVSMSNEAITAARELIAKHHGDSYLPSSPRLYKTRAKNAQEAHEAIRPTDFRRHPAEVNKELAGDEASLYELIWLRALASQMESAILDQVTVDIAAGSAGLLRATGSVVAFEGFLALYQEGRDDSPEEEEGQARLPRLEEGQDLNLRDLVPSRHFTQPPPRYSEASLVKKLEELGIGRPSTYAQILQVLQDRDYVRLEKKRFVPEDRGRLVTAFLTSFFDRYVQYGFTAELESELDDVSGGRIDWKTVLFRFWEAFSKAIEETRGLRIAEVTEALDRELGPHFFPEDPERRDAQGELADPRRCPACGTGRLGLRIGKTGGFIGCSNYPECRFTRPLAAQAAGETGEAADLANEPRLLGQDPDSGFEITLRKGPYGVYLQLGEGQNGEKPKRVSLPKGLAPESLDYERALALIRLPRSLGVHEGEEVTAGIGRYGPYVKRGSTFKSIPADEDVLAIGLNRAVDLLAQQPQRGAPAPLATLGAHPEDGEPVTLHAGRYGPYVKHGRVNATLPRGRSPEEMTLDEAVELLRAQSAKKGSPKKGAAKTAAAKTAGARKSAAKSGARKSGAAGGKGKNGSGEKPAAKRKAG